MLRRKQINDLENDSPQNSLPAPLSPEEVQSKHGRKTSTGPQCLGTSQHGWGSELWNPKRDGTQRHQTCF